MLGIVVEADFSLRLKLIPRSSTSIGIFVCLENIFLEYRYSNTDKAMLPGKWISDGKIVYWRQTGDFDGSSKVL